MNRRKHDNRPLGERLAGIIDGMKLSYTERVDAELSKPPRCIEAIPDTSVSRTRYVRTIGGMNLYHFECVCGIMGDTAVAETSQRLFVHCEQMGFIQRLPRGIFEKPRLEEISLQKSGNA